MEHGNAPPNGLGQWLKKRRRELDLTQEALAARIDCSLATLYKIEAGTRRPSRQMAELLGQALGVPAAQQDAFVRFARQGGLAPPFLDPAPVDEGLRPADTDPRLIHLPAPFTPLLGRDTEIATVGRLLRAGTRLLTLVGPPGIGKTRLSIEVARRYAADFADGVYFVGLAPIRDPALVLSTVGRILGLPEVPGQAMLDTLAGVLGRKEVLLVLDNCEQVVEVGPQVLALLARCPQLQVLATSREILRVHGEQQYPVPPLPLPAAPATPDVAALQGYPAIALFVRSAQAAQPSFALTEENAPTILAICRRLDGLPLAIELVAARINLLPPAALLQRLDARLDLLTSGARDWPARQQTLRDCIAWSYDLLPAAEQCLFRRLGSFAGGWTLAAGDAVGQAAGGVPIPLLAGLGALLDKSLVVSLPAGGGGEPRYGLLETIREYAVERLAASGEALAIRQQHATFYLALAETAAPHFHGPAQKGCLDRLESEHDNVRAALAWSLSPGAEGESHERRLIGVRLAGALGTFWLRRSHLTEGRRWYRQALEIAAQAGGADPTWKSACLCAWQGMGELAYAQGSYAQARAALEQSLALARALDDKRGAAAALAYLGPIRGYYGHEFDTGRTLLAESIALFREVGDQWGRARATGFLGYIPHAQGDYAAARTLFEDALALFRAVQDPWGTAWALLILGEAERCLGHYTVATSFYEQSLAINRELGDKARVGVLLNNMANIARNQGDLARARTLFLQCLTLAQELGKTLAIIDVISGLAGIRAAEGQPEPAAQLLGAVHALHEVLGAGFEPSGQQDFDRHVEATQTALGPEGFARAWAAGGSLTLDSALDLALRAVQQVRT